MEGAQQSGTVMRGFGAMKAPGATLPLRSVTDSPYPLGCSRMFVTDIVHCDSDISIGCDTPLTIFQKLLRVLSSVRHFFSVARDTPLTLFQKILRVLSSVRHFFSVARDTPLTIFQKILRVLSSVRHFFAVARDTIIAL
jgi:sarcosine oxidase delta subunit